jgi:GNAT superfamily N-acetyltransferase
MRESGTVRIVAVAVAPDGEFVGNTEVHVHEAPGSTLGYQENTLVMPEHRGHRLGLGLKVATHRQLAERSPQLRSLVTWNSHVNPWMIQVNEKLGYQVLFHEVVMQGRRAG